MDKFYKFTAAQSETEHARLDLFGDVGGGFWTAGFDESTFAADMSVIPDDAALDVYINSRGGSVFTAMAIRTMLGRHKGKVTIVVAGMAASAATLITCAKGAHVVMQKGSMMLVHPVRLDPGSSTAQEMRDNADVLDKVTQSVREIYAEKTGMDDQGLDLLMGKESYLTAKEALALGFADEIDEKTEVKNCIRGDVAFIGGMKCAASLFAKAPSNFIPIEQEAKTMNLAELKAEYPELVEQIRNEAAKEAADAERARIQAIDGLTLAGYADFALSAKFDQPLTAEAFSMAMIKRVKEDEANAAVKAAQMKAAQLKAIEKDAEALADLGVGGNEGFSAEDKTGELISSLSEACKYR